MATFTREQCIERLGKWVEEANNKSFHRNAVLKIQEHIVVESDFFNYADIQQFMYILTRTACEWWIYPGVENTMSAHKKVRVQLRIRLF